jgi:GNAT superfamily N-acetyltransferase
MRNLIVRPATLFDVPRLAVLNRAAYPDLIEDGVVFDEAQLSAHVRAFTRGQLVAERGGQLLGALASFVPPRQIDPLRQHTWSGITDGGLFSRHDASGHTLYLADIYIDPRYWGHGVSKVLYAALRDLCRELKLDRIVAGGRLWGYVDVAQRMNPYQYVDAVLRGELQDRVLQSQLREGYAVRGLLRRYLHDWRSLSWATLLEWTNPNRNLSADIVHCDRNTEDAGPHGPRVELPTMSGSAPLRTL